MTRYQQTLAHLGLPAIGRPHVLPHDFCRGRFITMLSAKMRNRERTIKMEVIDFYDLISEGTSYHFCCILLIRSASAGHLLRAKVGTC